MQILSNEEFLDSEDYWKDNFKVKFIKINKDNTEWWRVYYKNRYVSCTSMLMAFKIANTAQEALDKVDLSIDHVNVLRKVSTLINIKTIWLNTLIKGNYLYGKIRLPYSFKEVRFYKCSKCGTFDVEMNIDEPELTNCIRCDKKITRVPGNNKKGR